MDPKANRTVAPRPERVLARWGQVQGAIRSAIDRQALSFIKYAVKPLPSGGGYKAHCFEAVDPPKNSLVVDF